MESKRKNFKNGNRGRWMARPKEGSREEEIQGKAVAKLTTATVHVTPGFKYACIIQSCRNLSYLNYFRCKLISTA